MLADNNLLNLSQYLFATITRSG